MDNTTDKNSDRDASDSMGNQGIDIPKDNQSNIGIKRDEKGRLVEGTAPGPGRTPLSDEQKLIRKATRELIQNYKDHLASALPKISPILIDKATTSDDKKEQMEAIKEINKIVVGDAPKVIAGDQDNPLRIITVDQDLANNNDITPSSTETDSEGQD